MQLHCLEGERRARVGFRVQGDSANIVSVTLFNEEFLADEVDYTNALLQTGSTNGVARFGDRNHD